jgi:hypothetical protein
MIVCTKECTPFSTCQYSDKERRTKIVCLYTPAGPRLAKQIRRDNERWIKAMIKQTDKEMGKYHAKKAT